MPQKTDYCESASLRDAGTKFFFYPRLHFVFLGVLRVSIFDAVEKISHLLNKSVILFEYVSSFVMSNHYSLFTNHFFLHQVLARMMAMNIVMVQ